MANENEVKRDTTSEKPVKDSVPNRPHSDTMGQEEAESNGRTWDTQAEQLLEEWHRRVYAAQSAHYASADRFRLLHYLIGVPAIIFSSIVATAIFAGLEKDSPTALWVASISILSAVLAGLETFLRFSERAAQYATAGDWYSAIRRDIEEVLHLPREYRGKPKDYLDGIRKEMNRVAQDSPELRVHLWQREARRFGVKEPPLGFPDHQGARARRKRQP
jgi:hypothetical protein